MWNRGLYWLGVWAMIGGMVTLVVAIGVMVFVRLFDWVSWGLPLLACLVVCVFARWISEEEYRPREPEEESVMTDAQRLAQEVIAGFLAFLVFSGSMSMAVFLVL